MKNPKVLVATPISSLKLYVWEEFAHALSFLKYKNKEILLVETDGDIEMQNIIRGFGFKCETLNSQKKMMDKVVDARNFIRDYALKNKFDYVLMSDADSILPEDIIKRLLKHNHYFVTTIMFGMNDIGFPVIVAKNNINGKLDNLPVEIIGTGIKPILISGMGCTLISKEVLEKVEFRCARDKEGKLKVGEDYCFSLDAREKGFQAFIDTNIQVKHIIQGQWDYSKA